MLRVAALSAAERQRGTGHAGMLTLKEGSIILKVSKKNEEKTERKGKRKLYQSAVRERSEPKGKSGESKGRIPGLIQVSGHHFSA